GMPQARRIPTFAAQPFTDWFARRRRYARSSGARLGARRPSTFSTPGTSTSSPRSTVSTSTSSTGSTVLLWPDTFNNHFHPETAIAAMELLESAGFEVIVPRRPVCCGRPLYDYGLLPLAKKMLFSVIDAIRDEVRAGVPVIVL